MTVREAEPPASPALASPVRPAAPLLLGVSLKLYLDIADSRAWARGVADAVGRHPAVLDGRVRLFALPSLPSLPAVREELARTPVRVGAQDLHWEDRGAFTGGVSGTDLRDVGCAFVEVGHAERRSVFGETDEMVALKLAAAVRNGLTPVLCIGEEAEGPAAEAADVACAQLDAALGGLAPGAVGDVVVAYEPVWAIGRPRPAPVDHIAAVVAALRRALAGDERIAASWVIYGGSAQAGSLSDLGGGVDGLFLGRFAHDPAEFARIVDEAALLAT